MKEASHMFKPNTMLPIYYDHKENKIYMINTTTRKIYYHSHRFKNLRIVSIVAITGGFSSYLQRNYAQFYLNELVLCQEIGQPKCSF